MALLETLTIHNPCSYFGRRDQLALMNWSLNIEFMAKKETEHQLAESGQALQQLGSMLDQQECRVRELEVLTGQRLHPFLAWQELTEGLRCCSGGFG